MFEQYRLSQLPMKKILDFHSLQSDLPQLTDPQVPSANSKPSQLKGWTPTTVIAILGGSSKLNLDLCHSLQKKSFFSLQSLSSMLPCS